MKAPQLRRLCVLLTLVLAAACSSDEAGSPDSTIGEVHRFLDPTRNIACVLSEDGAQCDIQERSWDPPPPPDACPLDWGNGLTVDDNGTRFTCTSDTLFGDGEPAPAGSTRTAGAFRCDVDAGSISCSSATGEGFYLSRARWEIR